MARDQAHGPGDGEIDHVLDEGHDRGSLPRAEPARHELGKGIAENGAEGEQGSRLDRGTARAAHDQHAAESHQDREPAHEARARSPSIGPASATMKSGLEKKSATAVASGNAASER